MPIRYYGTEPEGLEQQVQPLPQKDNIVDLNNISTPSVNELTDDSPMPFGKEHRGKKMSNVPANYLHWMWTNVAKHHDGTDAAKVLRYVKRNMSGLKDEYQDGIWSRPKQLGEV